jgi:ribonuclease HI
VLEFQLVSEQNRQGRRLCEHWIQRCGSGCGGLIRNSGGHRIGGFSRNLGRCNAYIRELWGVLEGLRLARGKGITKMQVMVDTKVVVQTLNIILRMVVLLGGGLSRKFAVY